MLSTDLRTQAEAAVLSVLPERSHDLARLRALAVGGDAPVVTVVGKYNHGKSRLLNELIGADAFEVADRRATVELAERLHEGARWMDAPGLDADVANEDDRHAMRATWLESDIRLMVHAAKEGELDADELALLQELLADGELSHRQTVFVLTQVDQMSDDAQLQGVVQAIQAQFPGLEPHAVSSTRHRKGATEGKRLLLEKSGIPALKVALQQAFQRVPAARTHEERRLLNDVQADIQQVLASRRDTLATLRSQQLQQAQDFEQGLNEVLQTLDSDMQQVLAQPEGDLALKPDAAEDRYKMTEGKRERNRLQIAYSRACLFLNAYLIKHGVVELPATQQTASVSLNTVIVAVLGVSVKYRKDLQKIFCTAAGHAWLMRDFTRYYELSSVRLALLASIEQAQADVLAAEQALAALPELACAE